MELQTLKDKKAELELQRANTENLINTNEAIQQGNRNQLHAIVGAIDVLNQLIIIEEKNIE